TQEAATYVGGSLQASAVSSDTTRYRRGAPSKFPKHLHNRECHLSFHHLLGSCAELRLPRRLRRVYEPGTYRLLRYWCLRGCHRLQETRAAPCGGCGRSTSGGCRLCPSLQLPALPIERILLCRRVSGFR